MWDKLEKSTYGLEAHLKNICENYPKYQNLYASWCLNKKACEDILGTVVNHYPHYSVHDARHSETIVTCMELLLGDERIKLLSPTDTWMLLHAAYTHDLGMALHADEIEKEWETEQFREYLNGLCDSKDDDLRNAARLLKNEENSEKISKTTWPLQIQRAVLLITAEYFRKKHGEISRSHLTDFKEIRLDQNGLIPERLIILLGEIAYLHTRNFSQVLELEQVTNGYGSDYVHPRFLAELLRLGDLLDADNGRFVDAFAKTIGALPQVSSAHREKHNATRHLLITPEIIEYRGDCPTRESYLSARQFVTWLKQEIHNCVLFWTELIPEGFPGYAPRLGKMELLYKGKPDLDGVMDMQFRISEERAFQLVEGSNIYDDKFIFIREIVQNALDAVKLQLWRDLCSGQYDTWIKGKCLQTLHPYEIPHEIYDNYKIMVRIKPQEDGSSIVEITDRGTGLSVADFKRMCGVGDSYHSASDAEKERRNMPVWMRPTSGFGIGIQSVFLVTDQFTMHTKANGAPSLDVELLTYKKGGYLRVEKAQEEYKRGTSVRVHVPRIESIRYSLGGVVDDFLEHDFDPFSSRDCVVSLKLFETLLNHCDETLFPIEVCCEGVEGLETIINAHDTFRNFDEVEGWKKDGVYHYQLLDGCKKIHMWDMEACCMLELELRNIDTYSGSYRFKGMEVGTAGYLERRKGIRITADCYGRETKESITLDRKNLTKEAIEWLSKRINKAEDFFISQIIKELEHGNIDYHQTGENAFPYETLYYVSSLEQKKQLEENTEYINSCMIKYHVLERDEQNSFCWKKKSLSELLPLQDNWFVSVEPYRSRYLDAKEKYDYDEILRECNACELPLSISYIIADRLAEHLIELGGVSRMECMEQSLLLFKPSREPYCIPSASVECEKKLVACCRCMNPAFKYNRHSWRDERAIRYAIPAFSKYQSLAVDWVPFGVNVPWMYFNNHMTWIISPITRDLEEKRPQLTKEEFCNEIMNSPSFGNIVQIVMEHSVNGVGLTKQRIEGEYKKLIMDYYENSSR